MSGRVTAGQAAAILGMGSSGIRELECRGLLVGEDGQEACPMGMRRLRLYDRSIVVHIAETRRRLQHGRARVPYDELAKALEGAK